MATTVLPEPTSPCTSQPSAGNAAITDFAEDLLRAAVKQREVSQKLTHKPITATDQIELGTRTPLRVSTPRRPSATEGIHQRPTGAGPDQLAGIVRCMQSLKRVRQADQRPIRARYRWSGQACARATPGRSVDGSGLPQPFRQAIDRHQTTDVADRLALLLSSTSINGSWKVTP